MVSIEKGRENKRLEQIKTRPTTIIQNNLGNKFSSIDIEEKINLYKIIKI